MNISPIQQKNRKVALFDVCHTLVSVTTITDFTERFLLSRTENHNFSLQKKIFHVGYRKLRRLKLCGVDAYRRHFFLLFRGYSEKDIKPLAQKYLERLKSRTKPEILDKLDKLRQQGYEIYLVSAGLDVYLEPFALFLGAQLISTKLEKDSRGIYSGRIVGIDCLGKGKVQKTKVEIPNFESIDWGKSISFGDSLSDIPILSLTGTSVAVDPNPELERHATEHGWTVTKTSPSAKGRPQEGSR